MPEGFKEGAETLVSAHSFLLVACFLFFRLFLFFLVVGIKRVFANALPAHCRRVLGYALCRQSAFLIVIEKKEKHVELLQCFALQDRMDDVKIF